MRKAKKVFRRILTVIILFLFVFAASFVGFGYLVNKYSPEVDVQIGDTSNSFFEEKISNIDDRLKEIQNEDNGIKEEVINDEQTETKEEVSEDEQAETKEEVMKPEKKEEKTVEKDEKSAPTTKAPIPQKLEISNQLVSKPGVKTKVFAGYYTSLEEAVVAKNQLDEVFAEISPFIKEMNGYYVVQMGVYSNPDSAEDMYNKLRSMNFPAKTKSEQIK